MDVRFLPQHLRRGLQTIVAIFLCVLFAAALVAAPHDKAEARGFADTPAVADVAPDADADVECNLTQRGSWTVCAKTEYIPPAAPTEEPTSTATATTTTTATATSTATTGTCIELPRRGRIVCVQGP